MNISESFIKRPVMTILLMAAALFAGIYGYVALPVKLPNVDFPTTSSPVRFRRRCVDHGVVRGDLLETQFADPGLDTMKTSVLGTSQITLQFRLDRDIDAAAQDAVRARGRVTPAAADDADAADHAQSQSGGEHILQLTVSSPTLPLLSSTNMPRPSSCARSRPSTVSPT